MALFEAGFKKRHSRIIKWVRVADATATGALTKMRRYVADHYGEGFRLYGGPLKISD